MWGIKMITIGQPSLALNAFTNGIPDRSIPYELHYSMTYNCVVNNSQDMNAVRGTILHFLRFVSSGSMHALVINAHGMESPDGVYLGSGLSSSTLPLFNAGNALRDKFERIYLASCAVASTPAGQAFCRDLAMQLNCHVIASETDQTANNADRTEITLDGLRIPQFHIDEFEGTVYKWHADGTRHPFASSLSPFIPSSGAGSSCGRVSGGG